MGIKHKTTLDHILLPLFSNLYFAHSNRPQSNFTPFYTNTSLPTINGQLIRFQIYLFVIIAGYVYSVQCMKLELIVCDITVRITVNLGSVKKFSQNV